MKKILILLLYSVASFTSSNGQIITTVAGNGSSGYSGDGGTAVTAGIGFPGFIRFDHTGNLFIEELNNTIRRVSTAGIITMYAGNGSSGFAGDSGPATAAEFNFTGGGGFGFDNADNMYVADQANNRIRKINKATGIITTFAGTGVAGYKGDGSAAFSAEMNSPVDLTFDDNGNLYFIDGFNYRIRKIDPFGLISTIAGNGSMGFSGDNGPATAAKIYTSGGISFGRDNAIYLADGIRIRRIDLNTNIITTVAGNGIVGYGGDNGMATAAQFYSTMDVVRDALGNVYISDRSNNRIRKINSLRIIATIVGDGIGSYTGDGASATVARIYSPRGIALDGCDNLYIADNGNNRIRKVTFNPPPCTYLNLPETIATNPTIYPNPTSDILNIDNLQTPASYRLLNMVGAAVQHGTLRRGSNSLAIQQLPAGVYMLEVCGEDGQRNVSKVIKE